ncbi:glutathione S-transferase family protein [Roseibium sp.]|uniref:glutathione S-transferase family protein n=1 Tax=Roseibium sp. TaxID=1936156 RepID=UPI003D12F397
MTAEKPEIVVYHFAPAWGLPTCGPFALKLLAWLAYHRVPWRSAVQNNPGKGPKGKSPWVEIDGETIADSDRIIAHLSERLGLKDAEAGLSRADQGIALAFRTAFEERVHQILEYELFMLPEGQEFLRGFFATDMPKPMVAVVFPLLRRQFAKQLHARGITRHSHEEIVEMARRQFEGLAGLLSSQPFICGDRPGLADFACYGQAALMVRWPMKTPAATIARQIPELVNWCDALEALSFADVQKAA